MRKTGFLALALIFILAISMSAGSVLAVTQFKTTVTPDIYELDNPDDNAEFTLEIENQDTEDRVFRISQIDPKWIIRTEPLSHWTTGIKVPGRTSIFTKLIVHSNNIDTGRYKIILTIKPSGDDVMTKEELIISVPEPSSRIYQPSIRTDLDVAAQHDPRELFSFDISLKNNNPLDINQLKVIIKSTSEQGEGLFNQEELTTLSPIGETGDNKVITITKGLDKRMTPRNETIRVMLQYAGEIIEPTIPPQTVEFTGYSDIVPEEKVMKSFLKKTRTWSFFNDGNIANKKTVKIPAGWFESIFSKGTEGVEVKEDEESRFFTYKIALNPDEQTSFSITTNYRIPFMTVIALILVILGYFIWRTPLLAYKEVKDIHHNKDGHSEVKVQLHIKNRSAMTLEDVRIIDKIPSIAAIDKIFHIGTLEPTKITGHEKKGTVVKWEIDEIDRFEERLIVYKIHTKLAVVGGFRLPPMTIRFKTAKGDIRRTKSKPLVVKF